MRQYVSLLLALALALVTIIIWAQIFFLQNSGVLKVVFLNVGQGDAIFVETPSKRQVLIDGGNGNAVLRELGSVMPFWDRDIDIVVATHPDADHIGGLIEVFKRYAVDTFMRPGVDHDTPATQSLFLSLGVEPVTEILARRGQVFDFADGVRITILFPDRAVSGLEPNDASVIMKIEFGKHSFLLTGDSSKHLEEYVVSLDGEQLKSTVLKVGHHGSNTSSSDLFVGFVDPKYAILSRGCENRYGHPHQEVVATFKQFEVEVLDTCKDGNILFETDGSLLKVKNSQ